MTGSPPRGRPGREVLGIVVVLGLLGLVAGAAWSLLVQTPLVTRSASGLVTPGVELSRRVEADGWFAVLGVLAALPTGIAVALRRRTDPVAAVLALTGGAMLAALLCGLVGRALGPADPVSVLQDAAVGAQAREVLTTHTWVVYLVWPLAAALGALVALLLRSPRHGHGRSLHDSADNAAD